MSYFLALGLNILQTVQIIGSAYIVMTRHIAPMGKQVRDKAQKVKQHGLAVLVKVVLEVSLYFEEKTAEDCEAEEAETYHGEA